MGVASFCILKYNCMGYTGITGQYPASLIEILTSPGIDDSFVTESTEDVLCRANDPQLAEK